MRNIFCATALALSLAACSPASEEVAQSANQATANATEALTPIDPGTPTPSPGVTADANTLTLEGLGALKIGEPVPEGSGWAERGAQVSDMCRTISAPDYPGVYAIVSDEIVRRITVGQRSDVTLVEGIGAGATEAQVREAFPGFRETPHKYVDAPAKYLTAPNADSGDPALRFEIDAQGEVSMMHVGTMPVLGYVEGCA
ncbi:hypothetical protein G5C33_02045 [Sphingosinithalassobacter tenebrarum]|uniref:Lipoprotein n=2 Tax=Stakelama tenebrarum TaxID=2711215 RepID=A0A6G6YAY1_9SPHN|nr:hypothetical protein G5C33_02045 [Sphingosinithalassobacter tenebrarum]